MCRMSLWSVLHLLKACSPSPGTVVPAVLSDQVEYIFFLFWCRSPSTCWKRGWRSCSITAHKTLLLQLRETSVILSTWGKRASWCRPWNEVVQIPFYVVFGVRVLFLEFIYLFILTHFFHYCFQFFFCHVSSSSFLLRSCVFASMLHYPLSLVFFNGDSP